MELRSTKGGTKVSYFENEFHEGAKDIVRTKKTTTIRTTTVRTEGNGEGITALDNGTFVENDEISSNRSIQADSTVRTEYKTSDYSSEDNDHETITTNPIMDNLKNLQYDQTRRSVSVSSSISQVSALDVYRAAGDYWNKYPKTDYTYSPHSKDRREIAPGVVAMPNMSRRSLHRFIGTDDIPNYTDQNDSIEQDQFDYYRFRRGFNTNNYKYEQEEIEWTRRIIKRITSIFSWIYMLIISIVVFGYESHNSLFLWFGKKIHTAAGRIMLLDTWLLRTTQNKKKTVSLLTLCLLPLLAFAAWWVLSNGFPHLPLPPPPPPAQTEVKREFDTTKPTANIKELLDSNMHYVVESLLQRPEFLSFLKHEQDAGQLDDLKMEIQQLKSRIHSQDQRLSLLKVENNRWIRDVRTCCKDSFIHTDDHIRKILRELLQAPDGVDISTWLRSIFVIKDEFNKQLSNISIHFQSKMDSLVQHNTQLIMDKINERLIEELHNRIESGTYTNSVSDSHIKRIVKDVLSIYDADKTGLVDYALESAGGQVLSTRCTETYQMGSAVISVFGIPLWYPTNTPRTVLSPGLIPGKCWAFQNFPGFLIVKLSASILIEAISVEHVSKLLVPNGKIDSALKEFSIYALRTETDNDPILLGDFVYDYDGNALQYFSVNNNGSVFDIVELRIHSNHGNPHYTCLYRFRVHGKPNIE